MRLSTPQTYLLERPEGAAYSVFVGDQKCNFSRPASVGKLPKLYTLSFNCSLIYVGVASQSMSARLALGFRASGKGGYHGYKWKELRQRLTLNVWTAEEDGKSATLRDLEIIEAEVAFICRHVSGQWPSHQHEIHFYPSSEKHRQAASLIYSHISRPNAATDQTVASAT